jgi:hypothetical protein
MTKHVHRWRRLTKEELMSRWYCTNPRCGDPDALCGKPAVWCCVDSRPLVEYLRHDECAEGLCDEHGARVVLPAGKVVGK